MFRSRGVKTVITVDPHTTNMLRSVYPKYVDDYDLKVTSYLEVLADIGMEPVVTSDRKITIHDSCVYARYEDVIEQPRRLLQKAGATVVEPEFSGKLTHCCGGPIESFFPGRARTIAEKRIEQLTAAGGDVAVMCPICLVNLRHAAGRDKHEIRDISQYLVDAYCGESRVAPAEPAAVW